VNMKVTVCSPVVAPPRPDEGLKNRCGKKSKGADPAEFQEIWQNSGEFQFSCMVDAQWNLQTPITGHFDRFIRRFGQ
jgi:hypothetical protein